MHNMSMLITIAGPQDADKTRLINHILANLPKGFKITYRSSCQIVPSAESVDVKLEGSFDATR